MALRAACLAVAVLAVAMFMPVSPTLAASDPEIDYAVVWKQPPGVLDGLPNLKAIFSIGAGVDHLFAAGNALPDVPIVRVVADDLTDRMSEYSVWQVLDHLRKGPLYRDQQARRVWHEDLMQPAASEVTVGILGYGNLGRDAAKKLMMLGFKVIGWSRTEKQGEAVETFAGEDGLTDFLGQSDIVVCLLPLTPATRGILSAPFFARMKPRGPLGAPILINAGRGGLQVEADILAALGEKRLGAVSLDVFQTEPLPAASPQLWTGVAAFSMAGLLATVLGRLSFLRSIELAGVIETSLLRRLIPVFATVLAIIMLGERLSPQILTAFALIFVGIAIVWISAPPMVMLVNST